MDEKRKVTQEELDNACILHNKYIEGEDGGKQAVFENCSFERLSFNNKQFNSAVFRNCDFKLCDHSDTGMCFAELNNVKFSGCDCTMFSYLLLEYADEVFKMRFTDDKAGCGRDVRKVRLSSCRDIRILADTSSVEVYLSGGEKVLSSRFYPADTAAKLSFSGLSGTIFELDEMEVKSDGK